MKRTTFLVMAFAAFQCAAQSWFTPEAEWYYAYSSVGQDAGHVHGTLGNDTLIAGSMWKQVHLVRTAALLYQPPYTPFTAVLPNQFLREEDDIVQLLNVETQTFDTLYNMAAVPGDSWGIPSIAGAFFCPPESRYTVIDTGTWSINSVPLRWLAVDIAYVDGDIEQLTPDTIVERIGALNSFVYPPYCIGTVDGNEGGPVRCYSDADVSFERILWTPLGSQCAYLPNSISEESALAFTLAPNPSNGLLWIDVGSNVPSNCTLTIYDARGQRITTQLLRETRTALDLSDLPTGPYLIQIRSGASLRTQVWVKE